MVSKTLHGHWTSTYFFLLVLGYAKAGQKLFDMAMKAWDEGSDPYPIWGTCLGFELLTLFAAEGQKNLAPCYSVDQALGAKYLFFLLSFPQNERKIF